MNGPWFIIMIIIFETRYPENLKLKFISETCFEIRESLAFNQHQFWARNPNLKKGLLTGLKFSKFFFCLFFSKKFRLTLWPVTIKLANLETLYQIPQITNFYRPAILNFTKIATILCAKRVRNVFDGVAQTVSKIVCWVNAPFVPGSMMRRKFNSISNWIFFTILHHVFHT